MPSERAVVGDLVLEGRLGEHVAVVTLNRPEKRNAVNAAMSEALEAIVRRTEADPDVRVVILTSFDDKVFCAGADLTQVAAGAAMGIATPTGGFAGFVDAPRLKPWIAAVEGVAIAGGCEICLACDMIVASENARFGLPEVKRALIPGAGGVNRLSRILPRNIAFELIATGEPIGAAQAYAMGMVNRLTPPGQAVSAAGELARSIAANAPVAVQQALAAARATVTLTDDEARPIVEAAIARARVSEDYREGPRAFLEKRPPRWTGR